MAPEAESTARRPRFSLRLRLTLWMVIIFTILTLTYATILLLYQRESISDRFDAALGASVDDLIDRFVDRVPMVSDAELVPALDAMQRPLSMEDTAVAIFTADGTLLAASERSRGEVDPSIIRRAAGSLAAIHAEMVHEQDSHRVAARAFSSPADERFVMVVSATDRSATRMLGVVSRVILVMTPLGIAAAAVSGWFIAGIAVRPIEDARRVAAGWSPRSMGRQVEMHSHDSEVSRLEHELEDARKRIEAGFEAQARFMSNVSHELRTPISTVLTEAQVLDLTGAPPDVREFVHSTEDEMSKLGRLVESFLTLTRVRDGRSETVVRRCPPNELIMDSIEHCTPMAEQHGVRLQPALLERDDDLEVTVAGDPDLLRTMLDNLLRNAIRFAPRSSPVVVAADAIDHQVHIRVRDRGPGIPDEIIDTVFDRFAQAKRGHRRARGQGIGLEIAQGIAELHGGRISVHNLEGGGCEFSIALPRHGAATPAPSAREDAFTRASSQGQSRTP